jgi:hypothetical protein
LIKGPNQPTLDYAENEVNKTSEKQRQLFFVCAAQPHLILFEYFSILTKKI